MMRIVMKVLYVGSTSNAMSFNSIIIITLPKNNTVCSKSICVIIDTPFSMLEREWEGTLIIFLSINA